MLLVSFYFIHHGPWWRFLDFSLKGALILVIHLHSICSNCYMRCQLPLFLLEVPTAWLGFLDDLALLDLLLRPRQLPCLLPPLQIPEYCSLAWFFFFKGVWGGVLGGCCCRRRGARCRPSQIWPSEDHWENCWLIKVGGNVVKTLVRSLWST